MLCDPRELKAGSFLSRRVFSPSGDFVLVKEGCCRRRDSEGTEKRRHPYPRQSALISAVVSRKGTCLPRRNITVFYCGNATLDQPAPIYGRQEVLKHGRSYNGSLDDSCRATTRERKIATQCCAVTINALCASHSAAVQGR